ncbi:hypothetical protein E2C01_045576 [Portunus trituberculatus]|uniref:Uncharacterized protein n=1 Tax=Portunus trituberculatus TaxID=210409 RepID=A0A5B7G5F0_PORTR|nr:hypothetical protein [Portunus trituberculatus]
MRATVQISYKYWKTQLILKVSNKQKKPLNADISVSVAKDVVNVFDRLVADRARGIFPSTASKEEVNGHSITFAPTPASAAGAITNGVASVVRDALL